MQPVGSIEVCFAKCRYAHDGNFVIANKNGGRLVGGFPEEDPFSFFWIGKLSGLEESSWSAGPFGKKAIHLLTVAENPYF